MNDMTSAILCDKGVVGGYRRGVVVGKSLELVELAMVSLLHANHLWTRVRQLGDSGPQSLAEGRGWLMATPEANHPTQWVGD